MLIIALAVMAFAVSNPTNKLKAVVKDRDWTRAEEVYEKSFKGNDKREVRADEIFSAAVEKIQSEFTAGSMDYQTAKRHLSALDDFWDDGCVQTALNEVRQLNDSKMAFEEAEKCMEEDDYAGAVRRYGAVSYTHLRAHET